MRLPVRSYSADNRRVASQHRTAGRRRRRVPSPAGGPRSRPGSDSRKRPNGRARKGSRCCLLPSGRHLAHPHTSQRPPRSDHSSKRAAPSSNQPRWCVGGLLSELRGGLVGVRTTVGPRRVRPCSRSGPVGTPPPLALPVRRLLSPDVSKAGWRRVSRSSVDAGHFATHEVPGPRTNLYNSTASR